MYLLVVLLRLRSGSTRSNRPVNCKSIWFDLRFCNIRMSFFNCCRYSLFPIRVSNAYKESGLDTCWDEICVHWRWEKGYYWEVSAASL